MSRLPRRVLVERSAIFVAICLGFLAIISFILMAAYVWHTKNKPEEIGVTFSQIQAERHGEDWRAAYSALFTDLGFKHVRVAAYWNRIETKPGQYDFSELDWMIKTAKENSATVTIVLGQKVIRWPECYYPDWVDKSNPEAVQPAVQNYIKAVGQRYSNDPTIKYWQLENEFLLRVFGTCPKLNLENKYLQAELTTLRSTGTQTPIMLSASDEFGFPWFGPVADIYGFSMYKHVWNPILGYVNYIQPGEYNLFRAAWIWALRGQESTIHELQAEAWGAKGQGNEILDYNEAQKTMNPKYLQEVVDYARSTHIREFDLWGAETWWDYKTKRNQPEMWEAVRKIVHDSNAQSEQSTPKNNQY